MAPEIQQVYMQELRSQCVIAIQAGKDMVGLMEGAYVDTLFGGYSEQSVRFWYALQSFLTAAANISKLLWPRTRKSKSETQLECDARIVRGAKLQQLLGIEHDSPLKARALRNNIEHLDERLDTWAESVSASEDSELSVRLILAGSAPIFGLDPKRCFLLFDASNYHVTFAGEEFEILPISWAVHEMMNRLDTADRITPLSDSR